MKYFLRSFSWPEFIYRPTNKILIRILLSHGYLLDLEEDDLIRQIQLNYKSIIPSNFFTHYQKGDVLYNQHLPLTPEIILVDSNLLYITKSFLNKKPLSIIDYPNNDLAFYPLSSGEHSGSDHPLILKLDLISLFVNAKRYLADNEGADLKKYILSIYTGLVDEQYSFSFFNRLYSFATKNTIDNISIKNHQTHFDNHERYTDDLMLSWIEYMDGRYYRHKDLIDDLKIVPIDIVNDWINFKLTPTTPITKGVEFIGKLKLMHFLSIYVPKDRSLFNPWLINYKYLVKNKDLNFLPDSLQDYYVNRFINPILQNIGE